MKLAYGPFLPDLPNHGSPGVSEAVNLYPGSAGYRPVGQWISHGEALPAACRGAAAFVAPSGRVVIIAGTATKLYRQDGLGWLEVGTGYTLTATSRWRFVQFGAIAIATNAVDQMVKIHLETDAVSLLPTGRSTGSHGRARITRNGGRRLNASLISRSFPMGARSLA
jgi:hypothetical protein